ncbi:AraC family transcriptional regulator [Streptomyces sp. NPDC048636]|uniref:AraC family transcriptional regulator n=1 Tax=Streptomyces sp. NPDC048636 TaxID=3155762 RepID=UPI00342604AA
MVSNGHLPIPRYGFHPPDTSVPGFEATDLATLRRRVPGAMLARVHRADFHALTLITTGSGSHTIDFTAHSCSPGTLLWTRPGQVQRFDPADGLGGPYLMFTAAFPPAFSAADRLLTDGFGPTRWQLGTCGDRTELAGAFGRLTTEYRRGPGAVCAEILQLLLAALLLHIDRLPRPDATVPGSAAHRLYARFRVELERSYGRTRRADDYARALGCTVRTLTRACAEACGQSAKQIIDARVALQAKRLLAHTDAPVAAISRQLGFSEPTNFGKFFVRQAGLTPGDFRHGQRTEI